MIGRLRRVALREVWEKEATDFSSWLGDNLDVLNEVLDITIANAEKEQSAGSFNVDLVAEDESGTAVVIENQLEKSDHDHLGKLITYLTAVEAKTAIWIVADPRPEHVRAVSWLNESAAESFYLMKVEAVQIGESPPAALFTLIVGPSAEGKEAGQKKKELAERYVLRHRFFTQLLQKAKARTQLHAGISPSKESWVATGAGKSGLIYSYVIRKNDVNVELYIDQGPGSEEDNKGIFDQLLAHRAKIEEAFGNTLDWQRLDNRRASRIKYNIPGGGYRDEERWPRIQDRMIDAMICLERALAPHIARIAG